MSGLTDDLKLFADCGSVVDVQNGARHELVKGFTTNPTLMRRGGVSDYAAFGVAVAAMAGDLPVSLEVFADDLSEMKRQAQLIASWGTNVYVKIPVTTTDGTPTSPLIKDLTHSGVQLNVTAIMTLDQVEATVEVLSGGCPSVVSVFAGRIADSGRDPVPIMREAAAMVGAIDSAELLWASPRELLNVVQARDSGCHIITMTPDLWAKLPSLGKSLEQFSLETVAMFHRDAQASGFVL